jgi:hypothetical protein
VSIPDYCLACDRQLAPGGAHSHADRDPGRHWDGRMPLSVVAGLAWFAVVLGGAVAILVEAFR